MWIPSEKYQEHSPIMMADFDASHPMSYFSASARIKGFHAAETKRDVNCSVCQYPSI